MTQKNGGPAFPRAPLGEDCNKPWGHQDGMSLRDWFAGQALAGIMANSNIAHDAYPRNVAAQDAYALADAMLEARQ